MGTEEDDTKDAAVDEWALWERDPLSSPVMQALMNRHQNDSLKGITCTIPLEGY